MHLPPKELDYKTALLEEHDLITQAEIPIITVSSTFHRELEERFFTDFPNQEVVFSRAHYSMAIAVFLEAMNHGKEVWLTDPTNYVTLEDWTKILFTESVGRLVARHPLLQEMKSRLESRARQKLPITDAISAPLKYLTQDIRNPIISLHEVATTLMIKAGHKVLHVITDPYVRDAQVNFLTPASQLNITYAVFDESTQAELFAKARSFGSELNDNQVVVTGPPVDPRITVAVKNKSARKIEKRPINLAITTGGLGTNKVEIQAILDQLGPMLTKEEKALKLFLYAGTHQDFKKMYEEFAVLNNLTVGPLDDPDASVRILYSESLVEANELLIEYMFPWADGVITKPSGDMAYDAAAAGCFLLLLSPWGKWEEAIQKHFLELGIAQDLTVNHFNEEMAKFAKHYWDGDSWFVDASEKAIKLPPLYRHGCRHILDTFNQLLF